MYLYILYKIPIPAAWLFLFRVCWLRVQTQINDLFDSTRGRPVKRKMVICAAKRTRVDKRVRMIFVLFSIQYRRRKLQRPSEDHRSRDYLRMRDAQTILFSIRPKTVFFNVKNFIFLSSVNIFVFSNLMLVLVEIPKPAVVCTLRIFKLKFCVLHLDKFYLKFIFSDLSEICCIYLNLYYFRKSISL